MYKKLTTCIFMIFISAPVFSQFVIINITWINTDKSLLGVLSQKLAVNSVILTEQTYIHNGLKDIRDSKIKTRKKEYERNKHDKSLKIPLLQNQVINNLLLGTVLLTPSSFPFYITAAKNEYFSRELAINNLIALKIALEKNNRIRNANTQQLHSLNRKMLTNLTKTNKNVHKNATFVIVASLLSKTATMPASDLDQILSFKY